MIVSVDNGLLRIRTGCARPSFSLIMYVDWLKVTTGAACGLKFAMLAAMIIIVIATVHFNCHKYT